MKGVISLDALMAFLIVIFLVFWIQSLTSMNITSINAFGRKVQAKQEAIRAAAIVNSFYATSPNSTDYANITQGAVTSFENTTVQTLFSKSFGSNVIEARVILGTNAYEKAQSIVVKGVNYSNGEVREP